jgi:branched-chain amino acid transport system substrate-binding protein
MHLTRRRLIHTATIAFAIASGITSANAQKKYDTGATDATIKIGNIMPYSGPASAYATIGKTEAAYFKKINSEGGINGRQIEFISYDDTYSPPKTVEQARSWWRATRCCWFSIHSERRATRRSRNT